MSREIYLDHPEHGAHVVYTTGEAEEMAKRGWVRRPADWVNPKLRKAEPVVSDAQDDPEPEAPRRGRPPKK